MQEVDVKAKPMFEKAIIPTYESKGASGFDFYSIKDYKIKPGKTELVRTGISVEIPEGYEIVIRPRSGLSLKTKLRVANSPGTIDSDYRGEIKIILENTGEETAEIKTGDRIAQGVLQEVLRSNFIKVRKLDQTDRGEGGFGHTGK